MKIIEAINRIDSLLHNTYDQVKKVEWLSELDGYVKTNIIDTHEGRELVTFTGYDANTDIQTELLVPAPFDSVYLKWLEAQIHYANGEYDRYNNAIVMYNASYDAYAAYYHRTRMPIINGRRFLF